jgi:hypothetical protein
MDILILHRRNKFHRTFFPSSFCRFVGKFLPDHCPVDLPFGGIGFFGHDGGVTDIPYDLLRAVRDISCDLSRREFLFR